VASKTKRGARKTLRAGLIGYGPFFNMGDHHIKNMLATERIDVVAVCDRDPARTVAAKQNYPTVNTYTDSAAMLKAEALDFVSVVVPHSVHEAVVVQCLNAGVNTVVEKPMCVTIAQADRMIAAAKKNKVMFSVFHNRRWDASHLGMMEPVVERKLLGDIFHVEACMGGYGKPRTWWRSDKAISGGAFYDWGAHVVDWMLQLMPGHKLASVWGHFQPNLVWKHVTNEDHCHAVVTFKSGAVADIQMSSIALAGKPMFRILGTKGALVDDRANNQSIVTVAHKGLPAELKIPFRRQTNWNAYYENIADHLLHGKPLAVTPESARRVIGIMDLAEQSWRAGGKVLSFPFE